MAKYPVEVDQSRSYFPPGWKAEVGAEWAATGGGVQSAALSLLVKLGKLPKPHAWVACDTHHETPSTHITWDVQRKIAIELGVAFVVLKRGVSILDKFTADRRLPLPHRNRPSCSTWAKRDAMREWIRRVMREDLGLKRYEPNQAYCWLGISTDEAANRMRDSDRQWIANRYPLVDLGLSRRKCKNLLATNWPGESLPEKSGCSWCPWLGPSGLADLMKVDPGTVDAVEKMESNAKPGSGTLFQGMTITLLKEQVARGYGPIKERKRPVPGEGQTTLMERDRGGKEISCSQAGACFT